ncbi:carboxypeptidase regulatory-like domain-containing protein [Nocardioides humilatus]|uniref:Carboxypeptidase regulatory-like domain-containing protein n=1 Tax=Nocardioides humilatus TaxID=2607660 RepID=A0A5B1LKW8_9ACTN|nr:carboxypeptidase-like regulatory domain-containing protein [Nocardioides humilatus]KAA1420259.1 carboxypeptidase regulatory-like domain-containing protein [Nocardioides humilatus]
MSRWDELGDDELMAELAEAVAETVDDPEVTERRRLAASAAFTWRTVDEELAELLHDSALDAGAAVRSSGDSPRSLSFIRGAVTIEIEVTGSSLLGEVIDDDASDEPAAVSLQRPGAEDRVTETDASGFFRFDDVAPGPVRFVVVRGGWSLTTPWATL